MRYEQVHCIDKAMAEKIIKYLTVEPSCEDDCLGEDDTITYSYSFFNGFEVDVKCCGVQYTEGECNTAWCEAVLFENGHECCCVYGNDDFFGEWELEYNGDIYAVDLFY